MCHEFYLQSENMEQELYGLDTASHYIEQNPIVTRGSHKNVAMSAA